MIKLILLVIVGAIIHKLFKLDAAWQKDDFSWEEFFKRNIITFVISIAAGMMIVAISNGHEVELFGVFIPMNAVTATALGYMGDSIIKKLFKSIGNRFERNVDV